uniref:hypothetical protein n=1 Tax=Streptomyces acidiscabies TaxID=42234 RepID=UPI000AA05A74
MPRYDSGLGRWVRALAADMYGGVRAGRQPAPYPRDFATRLTLALALRPMPPRLPSVSRPGPHWFPGLLTTFALVLTCLATAAAQGVLPTPWREPAPPGGAVPD